MAAKKSKQTKSGSSTAAGSSPARQPAARQPVAGRAATGGGRGRRQAGARQLGSLDRQLVELLNRRAAAALENAHASASQGAASQGATSQPPVPEAEPPAATTAGMAHRWAEDARELEDLLAENAGPLSSSTLREIFRVLQAACRQLGRPSRVAYLGPEYSYSHLAALQRFGAAAEYLPVATIPAVFEELQRGHVEYGLVPLENSTDGRVVDTLGMFARVPVQICSEVRLPIHHHLLGTCSRAEIREVYSKPQALSQCRDWLAKNLPGAKLVEATSTTAAARLAAERPAAAAVASEQAGRHYGLDVIVSNIEDNKHNVTRFAVLGDQPAPRTGNDNTALMVEIQHVPGALADMMAVFKRNRLNLTWIESFPIPGSQGEYLFFVELEGHRDELRVRRCLKSLETRTVRVVVLGSFARLP